VGIRETCLPCIGVWEGGGLGVKSVRRGPRGVKEGWSFVDVRDMIA